MASLYGNIYDLGNGWFHGEIHNLLSSYAEGLDGHYTVVFKLDGSFKLYKHGGYTGLTSYEEVEFKGFIENLTDHAKNFMSDTVRNTIERMQFYNTDRPKRCGTQWVFDYDYEFDTPIYIGHLKIGEYESKEKLLIHASTSPNKPGKPPTQQNPMTKIEIIRELFDKHFIPNPKNRSLRLYPVDSHISSACLYSSEDGKHCAVGMCLTGKALKRIFTEGLNSKTVFELYDKLGPEMFRKEYQGHELNFWKDLQQLHDNQEYWDDEGITDFGRDRYDQIVSKYKNQ